MRMKHGDKSKSFTVIGSSFTHGLNKLQDGDRTFRLPHVEVEVFHHWMSASPSKACGKFHASFATCMWHLLLIHALKTIKQSAYLTKASRQTGTFLEWFHSLLNHCSGFSFWAQRRHTHTHTHSSIIFSLYNRVQTFPTPTWYKS